MIQIGPYTKTCHTHSRKAHNHHHNHTPCGCTYRKLFGSNKRSMLFKAAQSADSSSFQFNYLCSYFHSICITGHFYQAIIKSPFKCKCQNIMRCNITRSFMCCIHHCQIKMISLHRNCKGRCSEIWMPAGYVTLTIC